MSKGSGTRGLVSSHARTTAASPGKFTLTICVWPWKKVLTAKSSKLSNVKSSATFSSCNICLLPSKYPRARATRLPFEKRALNHAYQMCYPLWHHRGHWYFTAPTAGLLQPAVATSLCCFSLPISWTVHQNVTWRKKSSSSVCMLPVNRGLSKFAVSWNPLEFFGWFDPQCDFWTSKWDHGTIPDAGRCLSGSQIWTMLTKRRSQETLLQQKFWFSTVVAATRRDSDTSCWWQQLRLTFSRQLNPAFIYNSSLFFYHCQMPSDVWRQNAGDSNGSGTLLLESVDGRPALHLMDKILVRL